MTVQATFAADFTQFDAAVQTAALKLKTFQTGTASVEKSLARMTDGFTGRKLIQDATLAAEAISRIGGTSKLTQSELERVSAMAKDAADKLRAMGQEVPPKIQALASAVDPIPGKLSLVDRAAASVKSSLVQMASGFALGNLVTGALNSLGQAFLRTVADAQKLTVLSGSFERLTASIGTSGGAMLAVTRSATKGLISDLDLMQSTNKAILLGLPVTSAEMGTLSKAAITLGRAMGQDATKSLDDLITALGRSSPLILDNLGLTVKVGEANQAYAQKLGKTVDELTDAEKKMAFYTAAMEAANRKTEELGDVHLTAADQVNRMTTAISDAAAELAAAGNGSGVLVSTLGVLADLASKAAKGLKDYREAAARVDEAHPGVNEFSRQSLIQEAARRIQLERSTAMAAERAVGINQPAAFSAGASAADIKAVEEQSKNLTKQLDKQIAAANRAKEAQDAWLKSTAEHSQPLQDLALGVKWAYSETEKWHRVVTALPLPQVSDGIHGMADAVDQELIPSLKAAQMQALGFQATYAAAILTIEQSSGPTFTAFGENVKAGFQTAFESIGPTIQKALMGGGDVLKSVGAVFGGALTESIFGKGSGIANKITNVFGDTLGGAMNALLPGLGSILGPLLNGIANKFKDWFGGPDAKELAGRDASHAFEAQLAASLTQMERLEAGGDRWKQTVIAVRDAYMSVGRTEQEALDVSRRLWEAEKLGPDAVKAVIADISTTLTEGYLPASEQATAISAIGWQGVIDMIAEAQDEAEEAADALKKQTEETEKILDRFGANFTERSEEMLHEFDLLAAAGLNQNFIFSKMGSEIEKYISDMALAGQAIPAAMQPIIDEFMRWAAAQGIVIDGLNGLSGWSAGARAGGGGNGGAYGGDYEDDGTGNARIGTGDMGGQRVRDLINSGRATLEEVNRYRADNNGDESRLEDAFPGFAGGTQGKYLDFGAGGTTVRLHNRERVMTEAEGQAEESRFASLEAKFDQLVTSHRRMLDELPRAIRAGLQVA